MQFTKFPIKIAIYRGEFVIIVASRDYSNMVSLLAGKQSPGQYYF